MSMDFLPQVPRLKLIIVGDRDDFCPLDDLYARLSAAPSPVEIAVVAGADHFYSGLEAQLFQKLCDCPFTAPQSL
jgi:fermentation-respiration switch protein FrsA (DUF1100 family)